MRKFLKWGIIILVGIVILSSLMGDEEKENTGVQTNNTKLELSSCEKAFKEAAAVSKYQDTHEDLKPAFEKCKTIKEFKETSENTLMH